MSQIPRLAALCAILALALPGEAGAQTALRLDGSCQKLVIAGQDLTAACAGVLANAVNRDRTTFTFSGGGRTLGFSGNGARQDATEETDALQPINLVLAEPAGTPLLAIGACRFSTPEPGRTAIACEANAADGRSFAGSFVTAAGAAPGASDPSAAPRP